MQNEGLLLSTIKHCPFCCRANASETYNFRKSIVYLDLFPKIFILWSITFLRLMLRKCLNYSIIQNQSAYSYWISFLLFSDSFVQLVRAQLL